jgi:hypothetical protein
MNEKLRNELDFRIRPAAAALTESLRVGVLVANPAYLNRVDELHIASQDLAQRIAKLESAVQA